MTVKVIKKNQRLDALTKSLTGGLFYKCHWPSEEALIQEGTVAYQRSELLIDICLANQFRMNKLQVLL